MPSSRRQISTTIAASLLQLETVDAGHSTLNEQLYGRGRNRLAAVGLGD
jgi:hypothetical protein